MVPSDPRRQLAPNLYPGLAVGIHMPDAFRLPRPGISPWRFNAQRHACQPTGAKLEPRATSPPTNEPVARPPWWGSCSCQPMTRSPVARSADLHPRPVPRTAWDRSNPFQILHHPARPPNRRPRQGFSPFRIKPDPLADWKLTVSTPNLSLPTGGRIRYQHQRIIVPAPHVPFSSVP